MKRVLIGILLLLLLAGSAYAQETAEQQIVDTSPLTEELPSEAGEALSGISSTGAADFWGNCRELFLRAVKGSDSALKEGLRLCAVLLAVVTLCAIVKMVSVHDLTGAVSAVGALGLCAVAVGSFRAMIGLASTTVEEITDYTGCLLPVMASAAAMSGGMTSASALYTGTVVFAEVLMQLITRILVPAVYFYLAVACAEAALGNETLSELREFVGWVISKSLRIVLYGFTIYMTLTGVVSGSSDEMAVKATKAATGMLPVVGGIISDASESLLVSAAIVKNSAGIFGMLAVLAICIAPFLRVGIQYLLLKLTAAVSGTVGLPPHVKLVKNFSSAMGYLLAMNGTCALMSLICVACFLRVTA